MSRAGFFPGQQHDLPDYLGGTAVETPAANVADDFWGAPAAAPVAPVEPEHTQQESLIQPPSMDANAIVTGEISQHHDIAPNGVEDASPSTVAELGRVEAIIAQAKNLGIDTAGVDENVISRIRQTGKIDGADNAALQQAMMGANAVEAAVNQRQMVEGMEGALAMAGGAMAMHSIPGGLAAVAAYEGLSDDNKEKMKNEISITRGQLSSLFDKNADGSYNLANVAGSKYGELSPQIIGIGQKQDGLQLG